MLTFDYLRTMSNKEIEEYHQKINEWWNNLDPRFKSRVYEMFSTLSSQLFCSHEWTLINVGVEKNGFQYCAKCKLTREIKSDVSR